ncbi:MAG: response regulator, partial [Clostridiales bacterium]|nr:response regulator [Clostridiales bacterium]
MRVLCVDDALPIMEDTVAMCRKLPEITSVTGFTRPREALEWLEDHPVDLALLDIDMPEISGLMLAEQMKRKYPDAAVIFLTAFPQYAVQAIKLRTSGYLLKPISLEDLKEEVAFAQSRKTVRSTGHIVVKTFGNFEIFVDGETLVFHRQKAKELLAYLIDRNGRGVNRPSIFAALWEEGLYDYSKQKYLDVIIRSLR